MGSLPLLICLAASGPWLVFLSDTQVEQTAIGDDILLVLIAWSWVQDFLPLSPSY
jgi:hypothetical protein